jgi:hypothetical protein
LKFQSAKLGKSGGCSDNGKGFNIFKELGNISNNTFNISLRLAASFACLSRVYMSQYFSMHVLQLRHCAGEFPQLPRRPPALPQGNLP